MEGYDPSRLCPKCGYAEIVDRYLDPERSVSLRDARRAGCIRRECIRCRAAWYERPLDDPGDSPDSPDPS